MSTFQDTQTARAIAQERVEAHVHVLTHSYWPPYPPVDITLPPQLQSLQDRLLTFYQQQFSSRKLAWQHGLGTCVLKARFPKVRRLTPSREAALPLTPIPPGRRVARSSPSP